jgi:hypothetical protein
MKTAKFICIRETFLNGDSVASEGDIIEKTGDNTLTNLTKNTTFSADVLSPYSFKAVSYVAKPDRVNHPSHYTWLKEKCGIEVLDITRHLDFNTGNAIKYLLRAGHKTEDGISDTDKQIEDLRKAIFYIKDKIKMLQK